MKLLIITQVVDTEDSVLGFFVRWLAEFAKHVESIEVVCLKEGKHSLPANVRVHSLGKPHSAKASRGTGARMKYIFNFYKYIWRLRREYDTVFVHMNPEYIVLGGILWKVLHKRIALWYTHKQVDFKLRVAAILSDSIFTASKESFRLTSTKVHVMGHGIDTDFFSLDPDVTRGTDVLSAGRLSPTKRHDLIIRAATHFPNDVRIVGEGPERQHLEHLAEQLSVAPRVHFLGAQNQEQLRKNYRSAGVFAHTSETGSLDKVILEALACGLPAITTSALVGLPITKVAATPDAIAQAVLAAPHTDPQELASYVREHHSLQHLVPAILSVIQTV
ncbi:MAG: glycosyltransferase [Minisyncoccia bacterium]